MSAGVVSGRPRNHVPSGMGAMRWCRARRACRARRFARGAGSWKSGGAEVGRIRRRGAGRPGIEQSQPGIGQALEKLVDSVTRGDPQSPLRWTCKSRAKLASALSSAGFKVSSTTVGRLLHEFGHRLQSVRKSIEGRRTRTATHSSSTSTPRPMSSFDAPSRSSVSTPRRWSWSGISRTRGASGNRRSHPRNPWSTTFTRMGQARRFPMASMT